MVTADLAVRAEGLRKRYGATVALGGFDLRVPVGSVYGLLGPNGAGKTTAVRVLATLLRPDGGRAEVAGFDVIDNDQEVRRRIGLVGQQTAIDEVLSGRQNLIMFGRLHHLGGAAARARAEELLDRFDLGAAGGRPVKEYSGGMRRRLDLAASLIRSPAVLFLDEPTTGLDPRGRSEVWAAVRALVAGGTTVLLTTQYLEEADQLADRIAVIAAGRVIADDTPERLKSTLGGDRLDVVLHRAGDLAAAAAAIAWVTGADPTVDPDRRLVSAAVRDRMAALTGTVAALREADLAVEDIAVRRPTLDEVFLRLTASVGVAA